MKKTQELTPRQKAAIEFLSKAEEVGLPPQNGNQVAINCWQTGAFTSTEQGQRACKQLIAKGLVVEAGRGKNNAQRYKLAEQSKC